MLKYVSSMRRDPPAMKIYLKTDVFPQRVWIHLWKIYATDIDGNKMWLKIKDWKEIHLEIDLPFPLLLGLWWSARQQPAEVKYSKQQSLCQRNFISIIFFPHYGSTNYLHFPSCNIIRRNTFPPAVFSMLRRSTFDGGRFFPAVPKWRCFSSESIFRQMLWHSLI